MPSPWAVIDGLMRELRVLRDDARALDARFARPVVSEVAGLIEHVAQAVDATMSDPESEAILGAARTAILEARERLQALKVIPYRPAAGILRRGMPSRPHDRLATER